MCKLRDYGSNTVKLETKERASHPYQATYGPTTDINVSRNERIVSVISGGALALLAWRLRKWFSLGMVLAAGGLVYRGITGKGRIYSLLDINRAVNSKTADVSVPHQQGIRVEKSVTINRSPEVVYIFWRNFENLSRFMNHLESVRVMDRGHSHWVAKGPFGKTVEWDAEIVNEIENELIAWRSLENADVDNAGTVHFRRAPGDSGTEVHVVMEYAPPAGLLGTAIAKLFGEEPSQQIESDLRRLKQLLEEGEVPTTEEQSAGPDPFRKQKSPNHFDTQTLPHPRHEDIVEEASEQSFPASDSPGWSTTGL